VGRRGSGDRGGGVSRVLITGAEGFLGRHLVAAFRERGWDVAATDVDTLDVRDAAAVRAAAEGCDVVVDNAALVPVTRSSAEEYRAVNVTGSANTLAAAREAGAYAIHVSSSAIYGVPVELPVRRSTPFAAFEPYGASKAEAEEGVERERERGLLVASLRPRTLLGPGRLGLFDVIFSRVRAGKRVPMFGRGDNKVQMLDVADYCDAVMLAIEKRSNGDYNCGAPEFGTVREDLGALIEHAGTGAKLVGVPTPLIRAVLAPAKALRMSPFSEWHWRSAPEPFYFDITPAREELGWQPKRSNAQALAAAYDAWLERTEEEGGSVHSRPLAGPLARVLRGGRS
jgi:nucleoside-diphosphate-sugar epimerase